MNCGREDCNGIHNGKRPAAEACRGYVEKKSAQGRAWRERNRKHLAEHKKWAHRRRTYGLSREEVLELFESSDGLCALCYEVPATAIDHDHETGRVRGALCKSCNTGLGFVEKMGASSPVIEEYLTTAWR